ncbi:MAG: carbohydrate-binding family 25 protein [Clostridia bacterium]|jgi:hypothetical protein
MEIFDSLRKTLGIGKEKEEFAEESRPELLLPLINPYRDKGVFMQDTPDGRRIIYNGFLVKNGAKNLYAVVKYGSNDLSQDAQVYPMRMLGEQKFELLLSIPQTTQVNIAFKDEANNWDNNFGSNYTFDVLR